MPEYRVYTVGSDGHFIGFDEFECADDSEAIAKAKRLTIGYSMELWQGERFLLRLIPLRRTAT